MFASNQQGGQGGQGGQGLLINSDKQRFWDKPSWKSIWFDGSLIGDLANRVQHGVPQLLKALLFKVKSFDVRTVPKIKLPAEVHQLNVIVVIAVLEPTISFSESWFQLDTGKDKTTSKPGISFAQYLNEEQCLPAISKVDKVDKADKVCW